MNASNTLGTEILHPGFGGVIATVARRVIMADRSISYTSLGAVMESHLPVETMAQNGSSLGSLLACSSVRSRNLPGLSRNSQACSVSVPFNHERWARKCSGIVIRFATSDFRCTGVRVSGAEPSFDLPLFTTLANYNSLHFQSHTKIPIDNYQYLPHHTITCGLSQTHPTLWGV